VEGKEGGARKRRVVSDGRGFARRRARLVRIYGGAAARGFSMRSPRSSSRSSATGRSGGRSGGGGGGTVMRVPPRKERGVGCLVLVRVREKSGPRLEWYGLARGGFAYWPVGPTGEVDGGGGRRPARATSISLRRVLRLGWVGYQIHTMVSYKIHPLKRIFCILYIIFPQFLNYCRC
jgi:hypothetical protein